MRPHASASRRVEATGGVGAVVPDARGRLAWRTLPDIDSGQSGSRCGHAQRTPQAAATPYLPPDLPPYFRD
jgi:hypothetical protein